jgi:hypothetical protein
MSKTTDGGRAALAGFLYQLLAVPGLTALAASGTDPSANGRELEWLLDVTRESELEPEQLEQDIVINLKLGSRKCVLAQLKYSTAIPPKPIGKKELEEIAAGFRKSTRRAREDGRIVDGYAIVSNRKLGPTALRRIGSAKQSRPQTAGSPKCILATLETVDVQMEKWRDALDCYAHSLGLLDSEIDDGEAKFVFDLWKMTANESRPRITEEGLRSALTKSSCAARLTCSCVAERSKVDTEYQMGQHKVAPRSRRAAIIEEMVAKSYQTPVVARALPSVSGLWKELQREKLVRSLRSSWRVT